MIYKKIILTLSSGHITPLESDTILSYIFAYNFEKLNSIYKKFQDGNDLPFLITNGFLENTLPKPMFFNDSLKKENYSLLKDIEDEANRKESKKISSFPINKELFRLLFEAKKDEKDIYESLINEIVKNKKVETESHFKNSIPRFNIGETNPYEIEKITFSNSKFIIYVKVFNDKDFELFFDCLKNTFEKIGFGKGKSRGYGHFTLVKNEDLAKNELDTFEYFEKLKKQNIYFVLNNYKPKNEEIESFDLEKSFYQINSKHTKSLSELNQNIFKGQMNFINSGSVIYSEKELIGENYNSGNSYNFGFIF